MEIKNVCLVMADISGYTRFIKFHYTSLLHAEQIISELLEAVIDAAEFPLRVVKLEGDAVLLCAEASPGSETRAARDVARQIERLFAAFTNKERALIACDNGCVCEACRNIGQLKLKVVLHYGQVVLKRIRQLEDLSGAEAFLVRRLMKNSLPSREYVLMTETFYELSGGLARGTACFSDTPEKHLETYADLGPVPVVVYHPSRESIPEPPKESAAAFSSRLNQHAFGRMLGRRTPRAFNHLAPGRLNLLLYLGEGLFSGLNVLMRQVERWKLNGWR